jgi:DNA-binding CsgD family transcriptional regulator
MMDQALRIHKKLETKIGIAICYGSIGNNYRYIGEFRIAIACQIKAMRISKEINYDIGVATCLSNIGGLYHELKEYEKAIPFMLRSLDMYKKLEIQGGIARLLGNLGIIYSEREFSVFSFEKSEEYLLQATEMNKKLGIHKTLHTNYYYLYELYEEAQILDKAIIYLKLAYTIEKEILNEEVHKQAEKYHWERSLAEAENEKKLVAIQNEAERRILEEKVLTQKQLLEQKETEINKNVEELIRKNTLLQHIMSGIRKILPYIRGDGNQYVQSLMDRINRNITPLEGNKQLDQQITEVYSDMMDNLKGTFPDLTIMELRIACLISMKLTSANIATVLFLSKRTVESHRLSLRKKMHLQPSDDIYSELQKYGARKSAEQVTLQ